MRGRFRSVDHDGNEVSNIYETTPGRLMLGALLMIFTFKNRCGLYAVDLLGGVTGTGSGTAKKAPAK